MTYQSVLALTALVYGLASCSKSNDGDNGAAKAASSDPSASTETLASKDPAIDDEGVPADSPTQISGAWIIDCESLEVDVPLLEPDEGETVGGCTILDKESGKPANVEPGSLHVKLATEDGTELVAEAIFPPEGSKYHFYVTATKQQLQKLKILLLDFIDALGKARQTYSDEDIKADPDNIGLKVVWEQFGDLVNNLDLPTTPLVALPSDGKHLIFASHKVYTPNFGGLEGADALCAELGKGVGESLTWIALLSTSKLDARDRFEVKGPIYNLMAEVVAKDATELWGTASTPLSHAVNWTEKGFNTAEDVINALGIEITGVWTGSRADGRFNSELGSCADWTSIEYEGRAAQGHSDGKDSGWIGGTRDMSCSHMARIFCISQ